MEGEEILAKEFSRREAAELVVLKLGKRKKISKRHNQYRYGIDENKDLQLSSVGKLAKVDKKQPRHHKRVCPPCC